MLDDAAVDVVEGGLDDGGVTIGPVITPKIPEVLVEAIKKRLPVIVVEREAVWPYQEEFLRRNRKVNRSLLLTEVTELLQE